MSSKKLQLSEAHGSQVKVQVLHDKRLNNMIGWVTLTHSLLRDHRELPGRSLCLDSLCGGRGSDCSRFALWSSHREDISQLATALSAHIPEDHSNLRISALQRDVGVDEIEVALEFLQVLLVFWNINCLLNFLFSTSFLQFDCRALTIMLFWSQQIDLATSQWRTFCSFCLFTQHLEDSWAGSSQDSVWSPISPSLPFSSFSPHSHSSCSCRLVSVRFKSQIRLVLSHHGHITLLRITESLSSCKQLNTCAPSHCLSKLTVPRLPRWEEAKSYRAQTFWVSSIGIGPDKHEDFNVSHPCLSYSFLYCNNMMSQCHRQMVMEQG